MAPLALDSMAMTAGPMPIQFGPYVLDECIGCGGMAAVFKAHRRGTDGASGEVVVKTLLPQHARSSKLLRLFTDEARISTQLDHENIVRAHRSGYVGGKPFLELEYVSGWNLQQLAEAVKARGQTLPVPIELALGTQICRGLAYAHSFVDKLGAQRPIIHRDVSPANVVIGRDGSVKLLDFGSARLTRGETLSIDTFVGKLAYMSPEQLDRRQLDRRADVFALGALLHELLTGRPLFAAGDDAETVRRVQRLAIAPPSRHNAAVPTPLDAIVLRALERDPDRRYRSAMEMLRALEGLDSAAAPPESLLRYLGALAPDVFTSACEECGQPIPLGHACRLCQTDVDTIIVSPLPAPPLVGRDASPPGARRILAELPRQLRLRLYVFWAHLHNVVAALAAVGRNRAAGLGALRLRLVAAAEQIALLWACAWPRAEERRRPADHSRLTPRPPRGR
jgi:serine/threonine-protein kinase